MEGLVCMGMNPAVGGPNSLRAREGLGKLKWLVTAGPLGDGDLHFLEASRSEPQGHQD